MNLLGLKTDEKTGNDDKVEAETEKAEEAAVEKAEGKEDKKSSKVKESKKTFEPLDSNKSIISQLNAKSEEEKKDAAVKEIIESAYQSGHLGQLEYSFHVPSGKEDAMRLNSFIHAPQKGWHSKVEPGTDGGYHVTITVNVDSKNLT